MDTNNVKSTQTVGTSKSGYHHGNLAHDLVVSARQILEEKGLSKLSLRATAKRAGVSQAAPYHHFRDKEALLASIATQGHREFNAAMNAKMDQVGTDPELRMIACGVAYVEFASTNPALFRLMFGSSIERHNRYSELIEAGSQSYQTLEKATLDLKKHRSDEVTDTKLMALNAWCTVHGLATLLNDGGLDLENFPGLDISQLTEALLKTHSGK